MASSFNISPFRAAPIDRVILKEDRVRVPFASSLDSLLTPEGYGNVENILTGGGRRDGGRAPPPDPTPL